MKPIAADLYTFTGLVMGRAYLTRDPDGLTVIDTGLPLAADRILRQVAAMGFARSDVKRILITHAHPDHIGGLPRLKAQTGAQVCAHRAEVDVIEGRAVIRIPPGKVPLEPLARNFFPKILGEYRFAPQKTFPPTQVDRVLEDGERIAEVLGGLTALHTPGHAPGHMSFWQAEKRILFCGDVMMSSFGGQLFPAVPMLTYDVAENRRSIGKLAALEPVVLCAGHGPPMTRQTAGRLHAFARRVGAL